jgi:hypothetical protein
MYCPQCSTESSPGLQYCRSCGANLKVIGKAVALSEAIARSDRGPLPKIKEMIKSFKVEQVTDEISRALDRMNQEIARASAERRPGTVSRRRVVSLRPREKKSPEERREDHIVKGTVSMFSGIGLMIFLYYFSAAVVLKLPSAWISQIPFELAPVIRIIWLIGLVPTLSGFGRIVAGLSIRPTPARMIDAPAPPAPTIPQQSASPGLPGSVTEHTTNLLDPTGLDAPLDRTDVGKPS